MKFRPIVICIGVLVSVGVILNLFFGVVRMRRDKTTEKFCENVNIKYLPLDDRVEKIIEKPIVKIIENCEKKEVKEVVNKNNLLDSLRKLSKGERNEIKSFGTPIIESDEYVNALEEFMKVYDNRPRKKNRFGMGLAHSFAVWIVLKTYKPDIVIESGVFMGQSTWLIRETLGKDAKIYSFDPLERDGMWKDPNPNTTYYVGSEFIDLGKYEVTLPIKKTDHVLAYIDDHQPFPARFWYLYMRYNITLYIDEDNYPFGWKKSDRYSAKAMLDVHAKKEKDMFEDFVFYNYQTGGKAFKMDYFYHFAGNYFLKQILKRYQEFPTTAPKHDQVKEWNHIKMEYIFSNAEVDEFKKKYSLDDYQLHQYAFVGFMEVHGQ